MKPRWLNTEVKQLATNKAHLRVPHSSFLFLATEDPSHSPDTLPAKLCWFPKSKLKVYEPKSTRR